MKSKKTKYIILLLLSTLFVMLVTSCKAKIQKPLARTNFILGTTVDIILYDSKDEKAIDEAFGRIKEIEDKMTINTENTSEIINLNNASGLHDVTVSPDTFFVLERGLYYSQLSQGKFDITIGPIVKLWNIGTENAAVPEPQALAEAINSVDYKKLHLDPHNKRAKLDTKGMIVDLGAIAKGYAADEAGNILRKHGVKSAIINLGGNILAIGENTTGEPFKIGVQDPFNLRGAYLGILEIKDKTVVTSGIYEKYFEFEDKVYHHILDPYTGFPAKSDLAGVSVITDISIDGDGLSTMIFLLGLEKGLEFINNEPNIEGVFITNNKEVYLTEGIKESFVLTDEKYRIIN